jgi:TolA-binding protein
MGMSDEARAFYDEVISNSPKSKEAKSAQAKLKALKKK